MRPSPYLTPSHPNRNPLSTGHTTPCSRSQYHQSTPFLWICLHRTCAIVSHKQTTQHTTSLLASLREHKTFQSTVLLWGSVLCSFLWMSSTPGVTLPIPSLTDSSGCSTPGLSWRVCAECQCQTVYLPPPCPYAVRGFSDLIVFHHNWILKSVKALLHLLRRLFALKQEMCGLASYVQPTLQCQDVLCWSRGIIILLYC